MNHKNMDVWKRSMDLAAAVYKLSAGFPLTESYGLTSQIRRSAISIPSNLAEGCARRSKREFLHFLNICLGSIAELETQYLLAVRLNYVNNDSEFEELIINTRRLILGTRNFINKESN